MHIMRDGNEVTLMWKVDLPLIQLPRALLQMVTFYSIKSHSGFLKSRTYMIE